MTEQMAIAGGTTPHLLVEQDGAVLIATLNRPNKLNAITAEMMELLAAAVDRLRETSDIKVLLIRARGRYFCAGGDLRTQDHALPASGSGIRDYHRQLRHAQKTYDEMEAIEKPIVVAHQGNCLGAGLELSLSCDFRLAARGVEYALPEGKFGALPASNGVSRLVRTIGTHWARYFLMANRSMSTDRALAIGLIHDVFEHDALEAEALAFAHHLATQNGEHMGAAKLAIEVVADLGLAQARNVERLANSALMLMPAYRGQMTQHLQTFGTSSANSTIDGDDA